MNDPKLFFEPIAGYLMDTMNKVSQTPFVPHSLTKLQNLWYCKRQTNASTIIEVGSYKGVTTRRLSYMFDQVISIEIDSQLHEIAKKRCRSRKNVQLVNDDGVAYLESNAHNVSNAIAYLDGHFSGTGTGSGGEPEPALTILSGLARSQNNFAAIVIDDFREFGRAEGWPRKSELLRNLEEDFSPNNWNLFVQYDQTMLLRRG